MGLFSTPKHTTSNHSNIGSGTQHESSRNKHKEYKQDPALIVNSEKHDFTDENVTKEPKKEKKVTKVKNKDKLDPETSKNTHINSLLYHTSDDTIDMYTRENNSSDLLGRIYYDDFDSDSIVSPGSSVTNTPLLSPTISAVSNDYFSKANGIGLGSFARIPSATNIKSLGSLTASEEKFRTGISFDVSGDTTKKSLTLKVKHPKFKFRRNNKTFLTGYNKDHESLRAIKWLFDEIIIHGDTIVVLQVLDEKKYREINKKQAHTNLQNIEELNSHHKKISIVYEIAIGKPQKLLEKAIDEFKPQIMCIGTHQEEEQHKSIFAKTTISKFFLQYALVPVVVVKPTYSHIEILEKPIDSIDYFKSWLIQITDGANKDKKKRPANSRGNSDDRGRSFEQLKVHLSPTNSRSRSGSPMVVPDERSSSQRRHRLSKLFHER